MDHLASQILSPAKVSQRFVEAAIAQGYEQNPTLMAYSRKVQDFTK